MFNNRRTFSQPLIPFKISFIFIFSVIVFLHSCQIGPKLAYTSFNEEITSLDQQEQTKTSLYFLPHLPGPFHFNEEEQCFRSSSIKYLDLAMIRKSFGLTYNELIRLQGMANQNIPFYDAIEQIKIFPEFIPEKALSILLVSFDSLNKDANILKAFIDKQTEYASFFIIYYSKCFQSHDIEKRIPSFHPTFLGAYKILGAEYFSIFDFHLEKRPFYLLDFKHFFSKAKILSFFPEKQKGKK